MNKNKKIIILLISIAVIVLMYFGVDQYFKISSYNKFVQGLRQQIEESGFNNLSGAIKSIEGNSLRILAKVPENYSLLPAGEIKYSEKEFLLKILSTSKINSIEAAADGIVFTEMKSISGVRAGNTFSAIVSENILKNNELSVVELIVAK